VWEQEIGEYLVRFREQGDEFVHHISTELGDDGPTSASGSDGTSPVEVGPPLSGLVSSTLSIRPHPTDEQRVTCAVRGDTRPASPDQVEPWRTAVTAAAAALGERNQAYAWQAIVGTARGAGLDRLGQLANECALGPLVLRPSGVCMREYLGHRDRIDQGQFIRYSFPVIVTGRINTYTWHAAEPAAGWALRRVCALLTLATGSLWISRTTPRPIPEGGPDWRVPTTVGFPLGPTPDTEWTGEVPDSTAEFGLALWSPALWEQLDEDEDLDVAVDAHYQALRLKADGHPSAAYLTFVAAIEGFGMRLVHDGPCTCHPQCSHRKGVAEKRFRKALKTVMTNSQVKRLAGHAYELRSYTGHRGTLFGSERTFGYSGLRLTDFPITVIFESQMLGEIQDASRRVLLNALDAPASKPLGSL
jgi:hypothetical protein